MKGMIMMAKNEISKRHICPVCGRFWFEKHGSLEICEICEWQDDLVQEMNPDEEGGANRMSLNQARAAYKAGKPIE